MPAINPLRVPFAKGTYSQIARSLRQTQQEIASRQSVRFTSLLSVGERDGSALAQDDRSITGKWSDYQMLYVMALEGQNMYFGSIVPSMLPDDAETWTGTDIQTVRSGATDLVSLTGQSKLQLAGASFVMLAVLGVSYV